MSEVPLQDPIKLRPVARDVMLRLLRPPLGELRPLALYVQLRSPSSMIPKAALQSPPRCVEEREAERPKDAEEPARWCWAAKELLILMAKELLPSSRS